MLTVPENVVDDRGVGAGIQEHPLLFVLDVIHGEGAVPSELPSHGLEDKGKTSKKLQCVQPELGLQTLPPCPVIVLDISRVPRQWPVGVPRVIVRNKAFSFILSMTSMTR